jgi:hypothetical protein
MPRSAGVLGGRGNERPVTSDSSQSGPEDTQPVFSTSFRCRGGHRQREAGGYTTTGRRRAAPLRGCRDRSLPRNRPGGPRRGERPSRLRRPAAPAKPDPPTITRRTRRRPPQSNAGLREAEPRRGRRPAAHRVSTRCDPTNPVPPLNATGCGNPSSHEATSTGLTRGFDGE